MSDVRRAHARAGQLMDLGRWAEAEPLLRDVLAAEPDSSEVVADLARSLHGQDREHEAYELAVRAVALAPESPYPHLVVNDVAVALDDIDNATRSAQQVLRLAPEAWMSHYAMARALLCGRRPRVREAYDWAVQAARFGPNEPATHNLVGLCLDNLGDKAGAERAYRNALALDPGHTSSQSNLATLDIERGRLAQGAGTLSRALGDAPQAAMLHANLDLVLLVLARRLFLAVAGAALLLGVELGVEAPWWVRAVTGTVLLAVMVLLSRSVLAQLPRGVWQWGRGLFARSHWRGKTLLGLLTLVTVGLLFLAFAPHGVAAATGLVLLGVLRVLGVVFIAGWVGGAVVSLVRGK